MISKKKKNKDLSSMQQQQLRLNRATGFKARQDRDIWKLLARRLDCMYYYFFTWVTAWLYTIKQLGRESSRVSKE